MFQLEDNKQFESEILNLKHPKINHLIRKNDNSWTRTTLKKAARFVEHLEEVFTPNEPVSNNNSTISIIKLIVSKTLTSLPVKKF